jgi:hypothetical protein
VKSCSSRSFASDASESLARARAAVAEHPQALFTNFQWFLFEGQDTVFFTAASTSPYTRATLTNVVAAMVALAPQLTHGFVGASPGEPFPKHILDQIIHVEEVDSLDGYPDKWLSTSVDIFARDDLPLFRVQAVVNRNGPDENGVVSMMQVRSSHALLEGSDSALLTRSQSASHGVMSDRGNRLGLLKRVTGALGAWSMATLYMVLASILAPEEKPWGFRTLALSRHRLRRLANRLGVRQRSLYFALVTHALNGDEKHMSRKVIGAAYTMLDGNRNDADDDFFRVRALEAKFQVLDDFVAYVRAVDDTVGKIEQKDITKFQVMINALFGTLRAVNRITGGRLPGRRFWRFNNGIHVVLTLVPPHRTYGPLTTGLVEPIYCGAWHSSTNIVTFCPSRDWVTFNFSMEQRHIANVERVTDLLERVEAMDIAPVGRERVEDEANA